MRTLVVAYDYPWPADSGARMRLSGTIRALAACGPTDLFAVVTADRTEFGEPDGAGTLARMARVTVRPEGITALGLTHPMLPAVVSVRDRRKVHRALMGFAPGPYDLVWCFNVRAWLLATPEGLGPTVLDLNDLEDFKIRARLAAVGPSGPALATRMRYRAGRAWSELEARRWTRLYRRAARRTGSTVVCSALDAERARANGVARLVVVSNTYPLPAVPLGQERVGSPPTVLFQGLLRYPPNAEASRWLADEIGPALATVLPDVRIRLVGRGSPAVEALHRPPEVTVVGPVADIDDELRRADMVVVPLRSGSGTRLKILEAFAHRIPVVSTTLGAEGLGAEDDRHLLVADTAEGLAAACARVLTEPALRHRLVEEAHRLYLGRYRPEDADAQVVEIARAVGTDWPGPAPEPAAGHTEGTGHLPEEPAASRTRR
jgi:glycosyltransferase involved in cell wall biosynthesis